MRFGMRWYFRPPISPVGSDSLRRVIGTSGVDNFVLTESSSQRLHHTRQRPVVFGGYFRMSLISDLLPIILAVT